MFIGNDVVDLADPETLPGEPHPRFPARVCDEVELDRIYAAADPLRMLWVHWAAKESTFKAVYKLDGSVRFIPRQFRVELRNGCDGGTRFAVVRNGPHTAAVEIADCTDHLHAVGRLLTDDECEGDSARFWQVNAHVRHVQADAPDHASALGRDLLRSAVADRLCLAADDISITPADQPGGIPRLLIRGARSPIDVTLSHHGTLVGCAFAIPAEFPAPTKAEPSH